MLPSLGFPQKFKDCMELLYILCTINILLSHLNTSTFKHNLTIVFFIIK